MVAKGLHRLILACLLGGMLVTGGMLAPSSRSAAAPPRQTPQEIDVTVIADLINRWQLSAFRDYRFNKWISLGDITKFNERIADGDVQAFIDPALVKSYDANALYVDCEGIGCATYLNDIILDRPPEQVPAQTLWHEAMHAILDAHDSELLVSTDEIYTWYMEGVINTPLNTLTFYEKELNKGASCDQGQLDKIWAKFEQELRDARNTVEGQITSDAQIEQLRQLTGFHVDAAAIRQGYVAAGLDKCPAATPSPGAALSDLDLIFCIDVTSSMSDDIASVKTSAASIVNTIAAKNDNFRVAIIAYRDWEDGGGMFEDYSFSSDSATIITNINALSVSGGGDTPEAVFEALMRGIDSTSVGGWRNGANKQIILMGDAPPHNPSREGLTPAIVAKAAEDADPVVIQSLILGNSGVYDEEAANSFRELADLTGGNSFEAADASKVPEALQQTIQVIAPPKGPGLFSNTLFLVLGGVCCLGAVLVGLALLAAVLLRKKPRPSQPAWPAGQPGMPPYAPPQYGPVAPTQPPPTAYPPQYGPPVQTQPPPAAYPPQYGAPLQTQPPPPTYSAPPQRVPQPQVPPYAQPRPAAAPPPAHWQGETMLASSTAFGELVVEAGFDVGQRFPLKAQTRLGRTADNDIVLRDPQASRYHAVITLSGNEYVIADQGSANGTLVNGVRIQQPYALRQGDVVSIGGERMRFQQR
jgi:hypothetical protein